jgi:O-antigen ligase
MSRAHLARGVGLGAYDVAYPRYQTLVTDRVIDYAHNDYAQLFAESGLMGWILGPASIGMFAMLSFRQLRNQLNERTGWVQLGAAIGVCGILMHSFSDFNLHIPANAAWFAFAIALATFPSGALAEKTKVARYR